MKKLFNQRIEINRPRERGCKMANSLSPGQTITTCQHNISQHCWEQHVACVWPPCCDMLGVVGSSLKLVKFEPTTPNMSQQGGQTHANVSPNSVAIFCVGMLRSFGRGFIFQSCKLIRWRAFSINSTSEAPSDLLTSVQSEKEIPFSNSLIIHTVISQSACPILVRCVYLDTQWKSRSSLLRLVQKLMKTLIKTPEFNWLFQQYITFYLNRLLSPPSCSSTVNLLALVFKWWTEFVGATRSFWF